MKVRSLRADPDWLVQETKHLLCTCPFIPQDGRFLLDAAALDEIASPKDRVRFLIDRYGLPYQEIDIYLHAGLDVPGKASCSRSFDTSALKLEFGQRIARINPDGTYLLFDGRDPENIRMTRVETPLPLCNKRLAVYLNQDFLSPSALMNAIIAHEVAHLYLLAHGLQTFDSTSDLVDRKEEERTDIAAFVMGLGEVMLNGCQMRSQTFRSVDSIVFQSSRLGYLMIEDMEMVQKLVIEWMRHDGKADAAEQPPERDK